MLNNIITSIANRGLSIVGLGEMERSVKTAEQLSLLCERLLSSQGEASGIALSREILASYKLLSSDEKSAFFLLLGEKYGANHCAIEQAATKYLEEHNSQNLSQLSISLRSQRYELLMRLNQIPEATQALVDMRADLLELSPKSQFIKEVDSDFVNLFTAWFSRGFLELRNIDWNTPAIILERIIKYEAVHGISGWNALRERIDPSDRHIYGFFHPRLVDEPLIFVEVALTEYIPSSIDQILSKNRQAINPDNAKVAAFYSISNCQAGLRGIPLGSFLIKQVVEDLRIRHSNLKDFVTLSPIPTLRGWMSQLHENDRPQSFDKILNSKYATNNDKPTLETVNDMEMQKSILGGVAWYLTQAKRSNGHPVDPVAGFHLGNGARLEQINWGADMSENGLAQSHGVMVNYRYLLDDIEKNHENFANKGTIASTSSVQKMAKDFPLNKSHLEPAKNTVR